MLGALLALDGTGLVDSSAVQQQLFGQRGLAGVGMADDRKRPAALDFFTICHRSEILLEGGEVFSAPAARERRKHIFTPHKGIIIGKGGSMLKAIGSDARRDIEDMLEMKVNLKLFVKVRKDWRDSDLYMKNFGYHEDEK